MMRMVVKSSTTGELLGRGSLENTRLPFLFVLNAWWEVGQMYKERPIQDGVAVIIRRANDAA